MVGHFSINRRILNLAETKLPPNMQTEITAPATGIEKIDPTDAVMENPGANTARTVKVDPYCCHRQRQLPEVGLGSE